MICYSTSKVLLLLAIAPAPLPNFSMARAAAAPALEMATSNIQSQTALPASPTSFNVRDFGAVGDGRIDDTRAIQLAVNAAAKQAAGWTKRVQQWNGLTSGAVDCPFGEVVFPEGTYNIAKPIVLGRFVMVRGEGKATIRQTDAGQDTLYFHGNQRAIVENLHFDGGKTQLRVWTNNIGPASLSVADCTFANSGGFAIECRSYTKKWVDLEVTKPWSPYEVKWDGGLPTLSPNAPEGIQPWFNSTLATVTRCRFVNAMRGADMALDTGVFRDCQITTNPEMEGEFFRLGGKIHLENITALARTGQAKARHWIQNVQGSDGTLISVRHSSFDTDSERGMSLLHSQVAPVAASVLVESTRAKAAGAPEGAVVWIQKGSQPNILTVRNVTEITGRPVRAVAWEQVPDEATLESIKDQPKGGASQLMYKLEIGPNGASVENEVPAIFKPLLSPPVPVAALRDTALDRLEWDYRTLQAAAFKNGAPLLATELGLKSDASVDSTAALQNAVRAAAQSKRALLLPAGLYLISDTIELPEGTVLMAAGTAGIIMNNREKDLFAFTGSGIQAAKHLTLMGGRNAFRIRTDAAKPARIAFSACQFFDQSQSAVEALAGEGETGEKNLTELSIQGGILASLHGVKSNAARIQVSEAWAVNDPHLDNAAFFQNLGGQMRLEALLTNPKLWQGKRSEGKVPDTVKTWTLSKNARWVDNWGRLYSQDVRYGGECGGMCNVFHRASGGTVFINGGISRFYNGVTKKTVLFLEQEPTLAVLTNISTPPAKIEEAQCVMNPDGSSAVAYPKVIVRNVPSP